MPRPLRTLLRLAVLVGVLCLLVTAAPAQSSDLTGADLVTMNKLRDDYGFGALFGWGNTNPCPPVGSNWSGVTCDNNRVSDLILNCSGAIQINGPLPPIIADLTALNTLNANGCGITGPLPSALANMPQLRSLNLKINVLSGPIPAEFGNLTGLLQLERNLLTGPIPPLSNNLNTQLGGNFFTGTPTLSTTIDPSTGQPKTWFPNTPVIWHNCLPAFPSFCDAQSNSIHCRPNRPDCPSAMTISKVSGDGQRTQIGALFANPLVVSVTDASGNPVPNQTVSFDGPGIVSITGVTGSDGLASVYVRANTVVGGNTVTASVARTAAVNFGMTAGSAANCASTITVTTNGDSGAGTLRQALADVCPGGTVDLNPIAGQTIALSPGVASYNFNGRLYLATDVTILGNNVIIDGGGQTRLFFLQGGKAVLKNLTLRNGLGKGGSSQNGGSGAGMGGAVFQNGGSLTLLNVTLNANAALGGSTVSDGTSSGGGFGGTPSGGDLGSSQSPGDGVGGSSDTEFGLPGGFGGGGGATLNGPTNLAGNGGFGGGAANGFGSAAGSAFSISNPGFGGGFANIGGRGVGTGGGGAAFGGAIFVRAGTLSLSNVSFTGNTATGGNNAQAKGGALFLYNGVTFNRTSDITFSGSTAADAGLPSRGYSADPYNNKRLCPGVDNVDICGNVPANTLTVGVVGSGTVTDTTGIINCPSTCAAQFQTGATLIATPAQGYLFSGWSNACSGTANCTVSLAAGSATAVATFIAATQPSITLHPSSLVANPGTVVSFSAAATGNPTPTVKWQVSVNNGAFTDIPNATSTTLSVTAAANLNGNRYQAVFSNIGGSTPTNPATLNVTSGPQVTLNPVNVTVDEGQTAIFTAAASGYPAPTVKWQLSINNGPFNNFNQTSTTLSFPTLLMQNGYRFQAVFTNSVGTITTSPATLSVTLPFAAKSSPSGGRTTRSLPQPFIVQATPGLPVTFSVDSLANGSFNGQQSVIVPADQSGYAYSPLLRLSANPANSFKVTASIQGGGSVQSTVTATPCVNPPFTIATAADLSNAVNLACAGSTINIPAATFALATRLRLDDDMTLSGAGIGQTILDGGGATRLFFIGGGAVTIRNMTLQNGAGIGGGMQTYAGAGPGMGGAIYHQAGNLQISNVAFAQNRAEGGGFATNFAEGAITGGGGFGANGDPTQGGGGGDLFGIGGVTGRPGGPGAGGGFGANGGFGGGGGGLLRDQIGPGITDNNSSVSGGSGGFGGAAGIYGQSGFGAFPNDRGLTTIRAASFGGAIFSYSGALSIVNSTFQSNAAYQPPSTLASNIFHSQTKGGALFLYAGNTGNQVTPPTVTLTNTIFSGSSARDAGVNFIGQGTDNYSTNAGCPGLDNVDICGLVAGNALTLTVNGAGSVTDSSLLQCAATAGNSSTCVEYSNGSVTLTATAVPGYSFSGWTGGNCPQTGNTCTVNLAAAAASITATFVPATPTKLGFFTQPPATGTAGVAFTAAVEIQDASGVRIPTSTASVAIGATTVAAVNGLATFSNLSFNAAGTYTLTATSNGLANAVSTPIVIGAATASQLVFTTQPSAVGVGQPITPAVVVKIEDAFNNVVDSTAAVTIGATTVNAVAGVATFSNLVFNTPGSYTLTATSANLTKVSNSFQVNSISTSVNVNVTGGATYGQPLTFTATVTPASGSAVPTGTVAFSLDNVAIGSAVNLVNGSAAIPNQLPSAGSHTVSATFTPAANSIFGGNAGNALINIAKATVTIALVATPAPNAIAGTQVTLAATLTPQYSGAPSGSVSFLDGAATLGNSPITAGAAALTTGGLALGAHSFKASYPGDTNFKPADSTSIPLNAATVQLTISNSTLTYPGPAVFLVTVKGTAGTPTGNVTIYDGATKLTTAPLLFNGSTISLSLSSLAPGPHSLRAIYNGDTRYPASASPTEAIQVAPGVVSLTMACNKQPISFGQPASCTVSALGGLLFAPGNITWTLDNGPEQTAKLTFGLAQILISKPDVGTHTVSVRYPAQDKFAASGPVTATFKVQ